MRLVIGFGKEKQVGKDTLAQYLIAVRGKGSPQDLDIRRYAFADALKHEILAALKDPKHEFWSVIGEKPPTVDTTLTVEQNKDALRRLMQLYGTEYRRAHFGGDYWVELLDKKIREENPDVALITDVRFPNECDYIRGRLSGRLVELVRLDKPREADSHTSENSLRHYDFDFVIQAASVLSLHYHGLVLFDKLVAGRGW